MNLYALPPLIAGVIISLIGSFGLADEKKNTANALFSLCCLSLAAWFLSYSMMYLNDSSPLMALRWARIGFFGISFLPALAYHFANAFLGRAP
ncbi:MAG: histidine kinase N-terminal 7TM domain-containing protein, partial [Thermodesulfovibrionales bacterium]